MTTWGPRIERDGRVGFSLWAPAAKSVSLLLDGQSEPIPMQLKPDGWHEIVTDRARPGMQYWYVLPNGMRVPDPASRFQPQDVSGPSEIIDPSAHRWKDSQWRGRPWHEAVVYELHVGAFTAEGTFRAAMDKLSYLRELGVTAIEIMPVGDFPGTRNWGYDGTFWYAPESSYGRPQDLKALVDAAHTQGLMVLLDVIYNHFGPEGNYLPVYAPQFFTDRHKTPWGSAIQYELPPVRAFAIENALYWLTEFHLDGLRLDAVHAIRDDSKVHLLDELAATVREKITDRPVHLVLENEENEARRLTQYTAQWNDDVHHVLHTAATGEGSGYYADYLGDVPKLGRALAEGFAFQGEVMPFRESARGEPSAHLPPTAFIAFIQNHDQIGNRAFGERLTQLAAERAVKAVAATYLLLPQVPMLFMGEEWGSRTPFPFFCDFHGELAQAVREGRRAEFARFPEFADESAREKIPDPQSPETFASAKLDWTARESSPPAQWLAWYRELLSVRSRHIVPRLREFPGNAGRFEVIGKGAVRVRWRVNDAESLCLLANLSEEPVERAPLPAGEILWREGPAVWPCEHTASVERGVVAGEGRWHQWPLSESWQRSSSWRNGAGSKRSTKTPRAKSSASAPIPCAKSSPRWVSVLTPRATWRRRSRSSRRKRGSGPSRRCRCAIFPGAHPTSKSLFLRA